MHQLTVVILGRLGFEALLHFGLQRKVFHLLVDLRILQHEEFFYQVAHLILKDAPLVAQINLVQARVLQIADSVHFYLDFVVLVPYASEQRFEAGKIAHFFDQVHERHTFMLFLDLAQVSLQSALFESNLVEDAIIYHPLRASLQLGFQAHILFLLLTLVLMHLGGHCTVSDRVTIVVLVLIGTIIVVLVVSFLSRHSVCFSVSVSVY